MEDSAANRKRRPNWQSNLLLIGAGTIFSLLLLEAGMRLLNIQPGRGPYDPNIPDPVLGMTPTRSTSGKADFPEYHGTLILQTNNLGFYQKKDTRVTADPGVERIAALGDSFTAGATNADENFPSVIEQLMNRAQPQFPVEMLNAGVGRYGPYQCFVRLKHDVLPLGPKQIIVAEYVGNDFLDLIRQDDRPYLTLEPDGRFEAHPPRFVSYEDPSRPKGWLGHSRVFAVIKGLTGPTIQYQISRTLIIRENLAGYGYGTRDTLAYLADIARLDRVAHGMMLQILNQQAWFDHFPKTLPLSLSVNRYTIQLFRDLCRERGIGLTYTVIPSKEMIEPEEMADIFSRLQKVDPKWTAEKVAAFDNQLTDDTMRACGELSVKYVDLRQALLDQRGKGPQFYPFDMHMNPAGNQTVAKVLADALLKETPAPVDSSQKTSTSHVPIYAP
jgi:hypothetical protein